ncbi:MAG: hypothetical protein GY820_06145 [Gammaproteobacteria bacterium]|nr:hypothetical protein [Gammaproteobacteria bacterium]
MITKATTQTPLDNKLMKTKPKTATSRNKMMAMMLLVLKRRPVKKRRIKNMYLRPTVIANNKEVAGSRT